MLRPQPHTQRAHRPQLSLLLLLMAAAAAAGGPQPRAATIYGNEFAVHVPSGADAADSIASKHGFVNIGQIGSLKGYYLFRHNHVRKRSLSTSEKHHVALDGEPEVHWVQQQHEKIRRKRDYGLLPGQFPGIDTASELDALLLGGVAPSVKHHTARYRALGIGPHNIFPDPLFKEEWYLNGGAKDGLDMNVSPAWQKGYTGKGVVVSILDDGIQTNHPDLALNYDPAASTDINDNDDDPMPQDNGDNKHGTRCAGEVAAIAFNNYCGIGVAYNASIGGVRMLDGVVNDAVEARALGLNPEHIDVYSASWGPEDDGKTVDGPGPLARRAFIYGVTSGRKGKGSIFVWASGNGGRHTDSCNCDGYTNSIFTLSISSATQGGYKPWYLEECSSTLASTYSSGTPGHDKSVATVDMDARLRPDHICTVEHTGTSASAPLAAGICALALEANPALTWRDMQYLVVLTSRSSPLEKEAGWILNGVKRKVSHKFGYGLMDAGAMVSLAEQWTTVPPQHICKSQEITEERQIEPTYGHSLVTHMDVSGCGGTLNEVRFLEHVQCKITLRFFPRGNLKILLTSPMGTTSTLLFERPRDVVSSNFDDWPFLSVHYWGEKADGRWTLQIINAGNRRVNQAGVLKKWQLIFYGTNTNPIRLRSQSQGFSFPGQENLRRVVTQPQYYSDSYNGGGGNFRNYPDLYSAGSEPEAAVVSPNDDMVAEASATDEVRNNKTIAEMRSDCDEQCDPKKGCYGPGPGQCVACKHYRLDQTCVSKCPPRSFPNHAGVCWPCHASCETCAGAGMDSCLTCAPAHLRVLDLAVCLQQCPEGYFENTEKGTCVPCGPTCGSCQDRPDNCTSCEHHLVMYENRCYAACPPDTYETEDYSCAQCHPSCLTCTGSGESECVTCKPGLLHHGGACLSSCPASFRADKKRRECVPCPAGCDVCELSGDCVDCEDGWIVDKKGRCQPNAADKCDQSEFFADGNCRPCHSTCDSCFGPSASDCLSCGDSLRLESTSCVGDCSDGYFAEAGDCSPCLHTCTQCVTRQNCTACAPGLQLQTGECRATCAEGYYSDRGGCARCYISCRTCSGPRRDQCVRCPTGWQLAAGECRPECPAGFYRGEYGCQRCHHSCRNCKDEGPLSCTSCPPGHMLEGGLCMECVTSQYYDPATQLCKTCDSSCRNCNGPGKFSCTACTAPLHLDRLNNQCVPCCTAEQEISTTSTSDSGLLSEQTCCHCDETGSCKNSSPAGKRRIASGLMASEQFLQYQNPAEQSMGSYILNSLPTLTVAVVIVIIIVFVTVFAVFQRMYAGRVTYSKLPTMNIPSPHMADDIAECDRVDGDYIVSDTEEVDVFSQGAHLLGEQRECRT